MAADVKQVQKVKDNVDFLTELYWRWLDEREHEDIEDYGRAIAKRLSFAVTMTKKPFGFRFEKCRVTIKGGQTRADMTITEYV